MKKESILERFKRDTCNHSMTVENDNGAFRHLHFSRGRSSCYHFTLTTWPGHLCIAGDCGTYVFSRVRDMFDFFRMDDHDFMKQQGELSINPHYWAEKLQHGGGYLHHIYTEWSSELFEKRADEYLANWLEENEPDEGEEPTEEQTEIIKEVREEIKDLKYYSSNEWGAVNAVYDFSSDHINLGDFFESNCRDLTHGYIWCLYAIVWGIQQYDRRNLVNGAMDKFFVYRLEAA